jgi:hypothetical protein
MRTVAVSLSVVMMQGERATFACFIRAVGIRRVSALGKIPCCVTRMSLTTRLEGLGKKGVRTWGKNGTVNGLRPYSNGSKRVN